MQQYKVLIVFEQKTLNKTQKNLFSCYSEFFENKIDAKIEVRLKIELNKLSSLCIEKIETLGPRFKNLKGF
jgi:hypothetical protein